MIVIMKTTNSPIALSWTRPHCVFDGTMSEAKKECKLLNDKATRNFYEILNVPLVKCKVA